MKKKFKIDYGTIEFDDSMLDDNKITFETIKGKHIIKIKTEKWEESDNNLGSDSSARKV